MFQQLLLAFDETDGAAAALSFTAGLAARNEAQVVVVHVNQYLVGGRGHTVITEKEAAALVDSAVSQLGQLGIDAAGLARRATAFDVAAVVIDTARATGADAIVVGRNRSRRLIGRFGPRIGERIIRLSEVPVLTAPPPLRIAAGLMERVTAHRSPAHR